MDLWFCIIELLLIPPPRPRLSVYLAQSSPLWLLLSAECKEVRLLFMCDQWLLRTVRTLCLLLSSSQQGEHTRTHAHTHTHVCVFPMLVCPLAPSSLLQQPLLRSILSRSTETYHPLYSSLHDQFELCLSKCRTSSLVSCTSLYTYIAPIMYVQAPPHLPPSLPPSLPHTLSLSLSQPLSLPSSLPHSLSHTLSLPPFISSLSPPLLTSLSLLPSLPPSLTLSPV